jgi:hypothetical protein
MNWKVFIIASVSFALSLVPQNIFGCSDPDVVDYYTTFFSKGASNTPEYKPFYYTALLRFYDDAWWYDEEQKVKSYDDDKLIQEWASFCKTPIPDAAEFIYKVKKSDVDKLLAAKGTVPAAFPDSLRRNAMVQCLASSKHAATLQYLQFAKTVEPYVSEGDWENPVERDNLKMNGFIATADKRFREATDAFLKDKYAFQRCRLAFYNNRYQDCIRWYDEHFTPQNTSAVNAMAHSYKGGSQFRLDRKKEAAYTFSKLFDPTVPTKKQHMLGFLWATDFSNAELEDSYSTLARNDAEKAKLLGMFALHGIDYRLPTLEKVFALDPSSPMLPVLAIREINKVEELYLTPLLDENVRNWSFYVREDGPDQAKSKKYVSDLTRFFEKLSAHKATAQPALYLTGAAYLSYIAKDYSKAKTYIEQAKKHKPTGRLNEQIQLTQLLVMASDNPKIDAAVEQEILPAMQWLAGKEKTDEEYAIFARNFFKTVLGPRYEKQGDLSRAALSYSDIGYVQENMNTAHLLTLYQLYGKGNATAFEKFMLNHASFKRDEVVDVIGTSYLRDRSFEQAVEWLKKAGKPVELVETKYDYRTDKATTINVDPFFDYLNDWQRFDKKGTKPYTKLGLAEKLLETQRKLDTTKSVEQRAKLNYLMGTAYYNMSYYGNSWQAVAYNRSGSDWNRGNYKTDWEKEYYGVYKAADHYQKAYELTKDKEFKAAAYFMVVKCKQRQITAPNYDDYPEYEEYEKQLAAFEKKFKTSPLFSNFVKEFGATKFYKYTYNRCSYLRDFVAKQQRSGVKK